MGVGDRRRDRGHGDDVSFLVRCDAALAANAAGEPIPRRCGRGRLEMVAGSLVPDVQPVILQVRQSRAPVCASACGCPQIGDQAPTIGDRNAARTMNQPPTPINT